jgi:hypothetical protein
LLSERSKRSKSLNKKLKKRQISLRNKRNISLKQSERQVYLTLIVRFGLMRKSSKIQRATKDNSEKKNKLDARELKKSKRTFSGNKNKLTKHSLTNNNKTVKIERDCIDKTKKN